MKRSYNHHLIGLIRCAGMNQRSFSKAANIGYQSLSHIICKRRNPTKAQRFAIARFFNKTEESIFGKEKVNGSNGERRRRKTVRSRK